MIIKMALLEYFMQQIKPHILVSYIILNQIQLVGNGKIQLKFQIEDRKVQSQEFIIKEYLLGTQSDMNYKTQTEIKLQLDIIKTKIK